MARLEAEVTANIGPFERALHKATEEAREFAEKTKDVGKDVFKEVGAGKLLNLSGLVGATAAITGFAGALKESLEAFGHMETQVLRLKYNLKDPSVAREVHEWIESMALSAEESEKLHAAFVSLAESGLSMKETTAILQDLQAVAFKSGESVDSLAEAFRRAKAGGLDAGEGAAKLLKSVPGLANEIEKYKEEAAKKIEFGGLWAGPAQREEIAQKAKAIRTMSPADFVKSGMLTTALLEELLHKLAPRGMVAEAKGTLEGAEGRLSVVLDNLKESLGEGLAPAIKEVVNALNTNLPTIEESLKDFGTELGRVISFIQGLVTPKEGGKGRYFLEHEEELENQIWRNIGNALRANPIHFFGSPGTQSPAQQQSTNMDASLDQQKAANELLQDIKNTLIQVFAG